MDEIYSNFAGEPAYALIIRLRDSDSHVKPGEFLKFDILFTGAGNAEHAKLYVDIPSSLAETISEKTEKPELKVKIIQREFSTNGVALRPTNRFWKETETFIMKIPSPIFEIPADKADEIAQKKLLVNEGELNRMGTGLKPPLEDDYLYPPVRCEFTIAENAPPGDHMINFALTYKDASGAKWHNTKEAFVIHVEQWYEREKIRKLAVYAAYAAIISAIWAITSALNLLLPFLSRLFDP